MNRSIENSRKSLLLLPILAFAAPVPQAVASPRLALEVSGENAQSSAGGSQLIAQVIPASNATNTQVSVDSAGQQFDISGGIQAGENLFHRFNQLDLDAGQTAHFLTTPAVEAIFSQIGGDASSIDGRLKVSGSGADLFLLNPSGILFGPNARLELGGSFVATTADRLQFGDQWIDLLEDGITTETALAGSLNAVEFSLDAAGGAIANQGQLAVAEGQSLALLGNAVVNTGSLQAPGGAVTVLAARGGQRLSLGGGLLTVDFPASEVDRSREFELPRSAIQSALGEATGLSINADDSVSLQAGQTVVSGSVDVSSRRGNGGQARVLGHEVRLADALVDASGISGGVIHVGGDYQGRGETLRATSTRVDAASVLRADGLANPADIRSDGGEVVVWSDGTANFAGTATAKSLAATGDGGLVETSGKQRLTILPTATVSTTSVNGSTGQWLIDPVDLTVVNSGGLGSIVGGVNPVGPSTIDATTVEAGLDGNNISLQADNAITINSPIDTSANPGGGNVLLDAPTLTLNERVILKPGSELSGTATAVNVGANGSIQNGIDAAVVEATVNLAATTYREGQEILLDKAITLQGQGANNTIISGDAFGDGNIGAFSLDNHRVMHVTADDAVISGVTVSDGAINGDGAGLTNIANNVLIENSAFLNNQGLASTQGGGALSSLGDLTINNSRFEDNVSQDDGGAIEIQAGTVTVNDTIFIRNSALGDGQGGAINVHPSAVLKARNVVLDNNAAAANGGAIYSEGDTRLDSADVRNNVAQFDGGSIYVASDQTTVLNSGFTSNTAVTGNGGAIHVQAGGTLDISASSVISNSADAGSGGGINTLSNQPVMLSFVDFTANQAQVHGGAIASQGGVSSQLTITGGTFDGNIAQQNGGSFYFDVPAGGNIFLNQVSLLNNNSGLSGGGLYQTNSSDLSIFNTQVQDNSALGSDGGGGIALGGTGGTVSIALTTVSGNTSLNGPGGGLRHRGGQTTTIVDSTFSSNVASGTWNGGALDLFPAVAGTPINVQNSTFSGNSSGNLGGAIAVASTAQTTLNNVTVANNTAARGGGLENLFGGGLTLQNTIVAGNTATNHPDITGTITSLGNNIVQNRDGSSGYVAADFADATDPQILPLADNGGLTQTHALRASSPAVNAGNASATAVGQRGLAAISQRDVGAYELDNDLTFFVTGSGQTQTVNQAFSTPVGVTVTDSLGGVVAGLGINATMPAVGANASLGLLQTDNSGVASAVATANTIAGNYTVSLSTPSNGTIGSLDLTNTADLPNQIAVLNGNNQSTVVNTPFGNLLQLAVTDQFGNAVPSTAVTVNLPGSGASASAGTVALTTDAAGQATTSLAANTVAGNYSVGLTSGAISNGINLTNLPDVPAQLSVTSGDDQSTIVNTAFASPLQVKVTDQFGNAISGATVSVSLPNAGASVTPGAMALTTDTAGQATTTLTANTIVGGYSVGLTSESLSDSVALTNLPDAPAQLTLLQGDDQSTPINTAFDDDIVVQVSDQYGNSIPNATVTLTAPSSGASTTNASLSFQTNASGQGQVTVTANGVAGAYQLLASSGLLSQAVNLDNLPEVVVPIPVAPEPPMPAPSSPVPPSSSPPAPPTPVPPTPAPPTLVTQTPLDSLEPELPASPPAQLEQKIAPATDQAVENPSVEINDSAPLSLVDGNSVQALDASLSSEYTSFWGTGKRSEGMSTDTNAMLRQAGEVYGVRSAVLYALFVPQDKAVDEGFGATQVASMALNRQAQGPEPRDDDQLMLVLVSGDGAPIQRLVDVTRQEVLRQARLFRMAVSDPEDEQSYKPLAQQMYGWMLGPIEPEMAQLKLNNVMYALAPGLRTMPLLAMMDGDEFAIERYGISLIPSVDLLETDFGASPPEAATLAAGATEFEWFDDLPAVAVELEAIATRAHERSAQSNAPDNPTQSQSVNMLLNESFTQANLVKAQQSTGVKNIHLATHGEFNAGQLRDSYLQLWDGPLRLNEISQLGWDELELLILSACETAMSSREAELGFAGLAAAAGVESTIGSLWSVSDLGTLALMSEFYGQLSQEPLRFEALRQAQLAMMRGQTRITDQTLQTGQGDIALPEEWNLPDEANFSHPFYWSGFTLVGNPWW